MQTLPVGRAALCAMGRIRGGALAHHSRGPDPRRGEPEDDLSCDRNPYLLSNRRRFSPAGTLGGGGSGVEALEGACASAPPAREPRNCRRGRGRGKGAVCRVHIFM